MNRLSGPQPGAPAGTAVIEVRKKEDRHAPLRVTDDRRVTLTYAKHLIPSRSAIWKATSEQSGRLQPGQSISTFRTFPEDLPKPTAVHRNPLPDSVNAHVRRLYAADIRLLDDSLRHLVSASRELLGEHLVIVIAADHGESLGEHDYYYDHGDYVYNSGIRVPLGIILHRAHPLWGRGRVSGWVSLVDVMPTVLDLLGYVLDDRMSDQIEGRSLAPVLQGRPLAPVPVFAESGHSLLPDVVRKRVRNDVPGRLRSVTLDRWKLVWIPFQAEDLEWELYNVRTDPNETHNVYRATHPQAETLRKLLVAWLARDRPLTEWPGELSLQDLEALRALGYVD